MWFRGKYVEPHRYTIRGVIEVVHVGDTLDDVRYGVRLENGDFAWAGWNQVKERGHGQV